MFGGNKIGGVKAGNAAALTPAGKTPMVSGGAAMMLKSMGVDPAQMEAVAEAFINDVSAMSARVELIEKRLDAIEAGQSEILDAIAALGPKVTSDA
jgi:hypothetical protein